jgi:triacylglycerol lipase
MQTVLKYPVLLVHGMGFRDNDFIGYWGRIPKALEECGCHVYFGEQDANADIETNAAHLAQRIDQILAQTGAERINIIAHSKGGLDSRYAIAKLGIGDKVASLTTVNTPHRCCLFADYLLGKIPTETKNAVANAYNAALRKLGEEEADFLAAVSNLTDSYCQPLDLEMGVPEGILCQSVGYVMTKARSGAFPLNVCYPLVKHFSGENDGLVSEDSFAWGDKYTLLRATGKKGISHCDIIDLTRENIPGFDVREFYVDLVKDLKVRGF